MHPVATATSVRVRDGKRQITDGAETREQLDGFFIEWLKRAPFDDGAEVESRQVFETEDFAPSDPTGELRAVEERLRAQVKGKKWQRHTRAGRLRTET